MNTRNQLIKRRTYNDHIINIDEITELDADNNPSVIKNLCYIVMPNGETSVFNTSPYAHTDNIIDYAKQWIDLGCPLNKDKLGISQKWDEKNLRAAR